MAVSVSINDPKFMKGVEISINGVCAVPNGGSVEVDDETLALFKKSHGGRSLQDVFKKNKTITISATTAPKEVSKDA